MAGYGYVDYLSGGATFNPYKAKTPSQLGSGTGNQNLASAYVNQPKNLYSNNAAYMGGMTGNNPYGPRYGDGYMDTATGKQLLTSDLQLRNDLTIADKQREIQEALIKGAQEWAKQQEFKRAKEMDQIGQQHALEQKRMDTFYGYGW